MIKYSLLCPLEAVLQVVWEGLEQSCYFSTLTGASSDSLCISLGNLLGGGVAGMSYQEEVLL